MATETYGVGPAATKMNVGPNVNQSAVMAADGKVRVNGDVVFDPAGPNLLIDQADPATGIDYAASVGLGD